jgi:hypothetical protein
MYLSIPCASSCARRRAARAVRTWRRSPTASVFAILRSLLLATVLGSLAATMAATPIVDPALRLEGPLGDWRRVPGAALYDRSRYFFATGGAWFVVAMERGDADGFERARSLWRRSLSHAPANAYAWTMLAWSEAVLEEIPNARAALRRSWKLAPRNATLARERLALAAGLDIRLEPRERRFLLRDATVLARVDEPAVRTLLASAPALAAQLFGAVAATEE